MQKKLIKPSAATGIKAAPYQRVLAVKVETIADIIERGLIVDSDDVVVQKLPDGRVSLRLRNP